jgi:glucokinase
MNTLAIDIGGTKFTVALFDGERMSFRESRATDREGGPEWMLAQVESIASEWKFERCGIGFGGPVDFPTQTVTLSTHVGGWSGFPLVERITRRFKVPVIMDNDANVGAM